MTLFLQQTINGLAVGSSYAIFSMGFGLVFATMGILNVAHGTYATWGAILALAAFDNLGVPLVPAIAIGMAGGGLVGVLVDQLGFEPIRRRGGGLLGPIITSIGFWIILGQLAIIATGARIKTFPREALPRGFVRVADLVIPYHQIITFVVALVLLLILYLFMMRTNAGAQMRAVGWDPDSAKISGVNPRRVVIVISFIAAGTAAIAGILSSISTNNVSFTVGEGLLLKGFAAVIIGGFGDLRGAYVGGILIGLAEVLGAQYISNSFRDFITFGLLIVVLLVRPKGLMGDRIVGLRA
ncbi:branched-chain amino acid ABC transporter permease [Candidatus Spongiisocius sp.]|uniref:branched-chain amino acid ABC transporter permease n=1 Tax=Candidatus Spongiisocius sp. TaxID=3101273 RepID=UPI003B5B820F